MYGKGISREGSLIDVGVEQSIIRKSGAWYTYDGDQLGQGKEKAREFLKENPDVAAEIEKKILEKLGVGPGQPATPPAAPSCRRSTSDRSRSSHYFHARLAAFGAGPREDLRLGRFDPRPGPPAHAGPLFGVRPAGAAGLPRSSRAGRRAGPGVGVFSAASGRRSSREPAAGAGASHVLGDLAAAGQARSGDPATPAPQLAWGGGQGAAMLRGAAAVIIAATGCCMHAARGFRGPVRRPGRRQSVAGPPSPAGYAAPTGGGRQRGGARWTSLPRRGASGAGRPILSTVTSRPPRLPAARSAPPAPVLPPAWRRHPEPAALSAVRAVGDPGGLAALPVAIAPMRRSTAAEPLPDHDRRRWRARCRGRSRRRGWCDAAGRSRAARARVPSTRRRGLWSPPGGADDAGPSTRQGGSDGGAVESVEAAGRVAMLRRSPGGASHPTHAAARAAGGEHRALLWHQPRAAGWPPGGGVVSRPTSLDPREAAREICLRQLAVRPRTQAELATALAQARASRTRSPTRFSTGTTRSASSTTPRSPGPGWPAGTMGGVWPAGRWPGAAPQGRRRPTRSARRSTSSTPTPRSRPPRALVARRLRIESRPPEAVFRRLVGMLARKGYPPGWPSACEGRARADGRGRRVRRRDRPGRPGRRRPRPRPALTRLDPAALMPASDVGAPRGRP